jgi:hypothetical protein
MARAIEHEALSLYPQVVRFSGLFRNRPRQPRPAHRDRAGRASDHRVWHLATPPASGPDAAAFLAWRTSMTETIRSIRGVWRQHDLHSQTHAAAHGPFGRHDESRRRSGRATPPRPVCRPRRRLADEKTCCRSSVWLLNALRFTGAREAVRQVRALVNPAAHVCCGSLPAAG